MLLYCILNLRNGKRYIGVTTVSVAARWQGHVREARWGSKRLLCAAIRKYGPEAFEIEVLAEMANGSGLGDLRDLERVLIQQEGTMSPGGYNMTAGGEGASPELREKVQAYWSGEARAAHGEKLRAAKARPEAIENCAKSWTTDRRAAQSVVSKARGTEAARAAVAKNPECLKAKPGQKKRGSPKGHGRWAGMQMPSAVKAKLSAAWTPERRAAMSERAKAAWTPEKRAEQAARIQKVNAARALRQFHPQGAPN